MARLVSASVCRSEVLLWPNSRALRRQVDVHQLEAMQLLLDKLASLCLLNMTEFYMELNQRLSACDTDLSQRLYAHDADLPSPKRLSPLVTKPKRSRAAVQAVECASGMLGNAGLLCAFVCAAIAMLPSACCCHVAVCLLRPSRL